MDKNNLKNIVKLRKIIAIIESCLTQDQFETAKGMLDFIEFETVGDCKQIKEVLIKKEKEFII